ncbi:hypothetical protein BGZ76_007298, partial [Entomortierella beljakovae]
STGKPKGVMVEHAQVSRLFDPATVIFDYTEKDTWLLTHTISFDASVRDIWGAFSRGCKLIIISYNEAQSPEDLHNLIFKYHVTVIHMTPSAFRALMTFQSQADLRNQLRRIMLGGEPLESNTLKLWYKDGFKDDSQIVNVYGPTETTVHATYHVVDEQDLDQRANPIGLRIPDLTIYVLDSHGHLAPIGVIGELCIAGPGVSRGYLNQPDLTSEKFPINPFSKTIGSRMYKTGDLVQYLPDGKLMFIGRNDHQVKIRGYRIELGEIEAQLSDHSLVKEAVVVAIDEG